MKQKYIKSVIGILLLAVIGGGLYYQFVFNKDAVPTGLNQLDLGITQTGQGSEEIVPAPNELTKQYQSGVYPFSFQYPATYTVNEVKNDAGGIGTIVVQDDKGNGFQIVILPFDEEGSVLTKERVMADIPDLVISEVQEVELGSNGRGIAFKSDNEAFGGFSREVWFVFSGQLYQISTYIKNDPLLQAVLGTWQFKR